MGKSQSKRGIKGKSDGISFQPDELDRCRQSCMSAPKREETRRREFGTIVDTNYEPLRGDATPGEIDHWFASISDNNLIDALATAVQRWNSDADLGKLDLEQRLTSKQMLRLMRFKLPMGVPLLHHLMVSGKGSVAVSLLHALKHDHQLAAIVMENVSGRNGLSHAIHVGLIDVVEYIYSRLSGDTLRQLLCEVDDMGYTAVHYAERNKRSGDGFLLPKFDSAELKAWKKSGISDIFGYPAPHYLILHHHISALNDLLRETGNDSRCIDTLCLEDHNQRNALQLAALVGDAQLLEPIVSYLKRPALLLKLASAKDPWGNTAFHYATANQSPDLICELIKCTFSSQTRQRFVEVLSWINTDGAITPHRYLTVRAHEDNMPIYNWALESATQRRYLMFDYPNVLIISNSRDRDDADEEAQLLIKSLLSFGFPVIYKRDLSETETFGEIGDAVKSNRSSNGLVVAMMSHGHKGHINDNLGKAIRITDIEARMCQGTNRDSPKVLILQCCQAAGSDSSQMPANRKSTLQCAGDGPQPEPSAANENRRIQINEAYCPSSPDFCVLMSTGPNRISYRGWMMTYLADGLHRMGIDEDISTMMDQVIEQIEIKQAECDPDMECERQVPVKLSTAKWKLCPKQVLPMVLTREALKRFPKDEAEEFQSTKPENRTAIYEDETVDEVLEVTDDSEESTDAN